MNAARGFSTVLLAGYLILGPALCAGATTAPSESRLVARADGTFAAVPEVQGRTKIFKLVAREASWTLSPGVVRTAKTFDGVVPGPTLVVQQGDRVVIDYTNELDFPDTVHLHGIHGAGPEMDGVAGISQPMVMPHGHFRYTFVANEDGTFFYHSHGSEAVLDAGLYGGIIVEPAHPRANERGLGGDYLEMISGWQNGGTEDLFTINGKQYPATRQIEVRPGERVRIRWINISAENDHTMHTHGHYQHVIARDARPAPPGDDEDTVLLGPGQRVDVVVTADAKPGTWLVHCHIIDHTQDTMGMPQGLITAIRYRGTPDVLAAMGDAMRAAMPMPAQAQGSTPGISRRWLALSALLVVLGFAGGIAASRARRPRVL
jgi:manganese oxidase